MAAHTLKTSLRRPISLISVFDLNSLCRKCLPSSYSSSSSFAPFLTQDLHLKEDEVKVGMFVRVANEATLQKACERFDWWDRPLPDTLAKMASNKVCVVSLMTRLVFSGIAPPRLAFSC